MWSRPKVDLWGKDIAAVLLLLVKMVVLVLDLVTPLIVTGTPLSISSITTI